SLGIRTTKSDSLSTYSSSIPCSAISPTSVVRTCVEVTQSQLTPTHFPIITCTKEEPSEALISSITRMKFWGSCNWINFFIQWSRQCFPNKKWIEFMDLSPASQRRINLNGNHLQLAGISVPPILTFGPTLSDIEGGTFHDFFHTISEFYNFTYQINAQLFKEQGPGKRLANGSWTGVIGGIFRKEFDASFMGHQVTRYRYMHYTTPLFYDESVFI
ncbi:unnamed protein product, partial [Allacma fusca]